MFKIQNHFITGGIVRTAVKKRFILVMAIICGIGIFASMSAKAAEPQGYRPIGTPLKEFGEIPPLDYMLQTALSGSKEYGELKKRALTAQQCEELGDMDQGVSLIGVSGLAYTVDGACDGVWTPWNTSLDKNVSSVDNDFGGMLIWYPSFSEDGDVERFDINGNAGDGAENRYISLLTYHFQENTEISGFAFLVEDRMKFPQAGDVYVSQDGANWSILGSWDRNERRMAGDDYNFVSAYSDYTIKTGGSWMLVFSLENVSAQYIRFGFTSAGGRDIQEGAYTEFSSAPGNIMRLREVAVFGKEGAVNGETELLYNGIVLQEGWLSDDGAPNSATGLSPADVPYLRSVEEGGSRPEVINITVGRQLFVDNFLIEETDLQQTYHEAEKYEDNPILSAETPSEIQGRACAILVSGGVWYDMDEKLFKMWYNAGLVRGLAYATSTDGIHWERAELNEDGSNLIIPEVTNSDSSTVWIDYDAPASERYKLLTRVSQTEYPAYLFTSSDGIEWKRLEAVTTPVGDRSTFFYNPFRNKYVLSARYNRSGRARSYVETDDFTDGWAGQKQVFWMGADTLDKRDAKWYLPPQLYNFDAIAYESIMIGHFQIWLGPENDVCAAGGFPKITELIMSYSRDGYHFDRPDRNAFISATRQEGDWDRGYVESPSGGVIIFDDEIWFYYTGFSGEYISENGEVLTGDYYGGSIGLAKLRRDGFASLDGTGTVSTRKMMVEEDRKYLFVNVNAPSGTLKAEILDKDGNPVKGYTMEECLGVSGNTTKAMVEWKNGSDVSFLNGQVFQIRFSMENGEFYSFWLSKDEKGDSEGMTAAGMVDSADYIAANTPDPAEDANDTVADTIAETEEDSSESEKDQKENGIQPAIDEKREWYRSPIAWIAALAVVVGGAYQSIYRNRRGKEK